MCLYIFFIILIIFIILYFINKNIIKKENFLNITGDITTIDPGINPKDCTIGTSCETLNDGWGIYNNDCICIPLKEHEEEEHEQEEEQDKIHDKIHDKIKPIVKPIVKPITIDPDCLPNDTNFDKICRDKNPLYGIKSLNKCNDFTSKVECEYNYLNGIKYDNNTTITPCLNKSDDFDTWCRYYTNIDNIPPGYNINSIGSKNILVGAKGGCFLNDGKSDDNSARAICNNNYIENIKKLEPANNRIDYNIFTECSPLNDSNFNLKCNNLMKDVDPQNIFVTQIMGYDCNPGYGRAKCIKNNDTVNFDNEFYKKTYTDYNTNFNDLNTQCLSNCK